MIVAGINAGVNPDFYWPWAQCKNHLVTGDPLTDPGSTPPADTNGCYLNGNSKGVYNATLLFVGLSMFVLFGGIGAGLMLGHIVPSTLGFAGAEVKGGFEIAGDGLELRPFKAVKDSLKEGISTPLHYVGMGGREVHHRRR